MRTLELAEKKMIENEAEKFLSGLRLADYLISYSESKQDYVDDVKMIIESNNFI